MIKLLPWKLELTPCFGDSNGGEFIMCCVGTGPLIIHTPIYNTVPLTAWVTINTPLITPCSNRGHMTSPKAP